MVAIRTMLGEVHGKPAMFDWRELICFSVGSAILRQIGAKLPFQPAKPKGFLLC